MTKDVTDPTIQHVFILFEGRGPPPSRHHYEDSYFFEDDGATEIGASDNDESDDGFDMIASPASPSPPVQNEHLVSFFRKYFILCGCIRREKIFESKALLPLTDLYKDQRPLSICHLAESDRIIVSGTCGLLGMVSHRADYSGLIVKPAFVHFNEDSTLSASTVITHHADVVVTSTDYSYRAGSVVSADSVGNICVWKLNIYPHRDPTRNSALATPMQAPCFCLGSRVHLLRFIPSGEGIIVGLHDKLLLLGIATNTSLRSQNLFVYRTFDWYFELLYAL
jgi:hypothetical protein